MTEEWKVTPWKGKLSKGFMIETPKEHKLIASIFPGESANSIDSFEVHQDNAHKIAAAPDMFRALELAQDFITNGVEFGYITLPETETDPTHYVLPTIQAALAKARGK